MGAMFATSPLALASTMHVLHPLFLICVMHSFVSVFCAADTDNSDSSRCVTQKDVFRFCPTPFTMSSTSFRTVYAFAREMHPKTVKSDIEYGTAGFRSK